MGNGHTCLVKREVGGGHTCLVRRVRGEMDIHVLVYTCLVRRVREERLR